MTDTQTLKKILQTEKTPLYVYDLGVLKQRIRFLRRHLPKEAELCYAVKANSFILPQVSTLVDRLEICSPGEYRICEALGLPKEQYLISGVNKEAAFIESLLQAPAAAGEFSAESENQFHLIHSAAKKAQKRVSVLLRVTGGSQFGMDEAEVFHLIEAYRNDPWVDICGLHYFTGTQKTSLKKLKRELSYMDRLILSLKETLAFEVRRLEYGPGFPVAYFEGDTFDEEAFLRQFCDLLSEMTFAGTVTLELGRSIAADCGTYLTAIADTKENSTGRYAIADGGMHQLVYYGQSMAMKHPKLRLLPADRPRTPDRDPAPPQEQSPESSRQLQEWNICGSLCTTNDFLVKRLPLPRLEIGDVLAFEGTGAYCATEGIALFLSRELPGVVLLHEDGRPETVRTHIPSEPFNTPQIHPIHNRKE